MVAVTMKHIVNRRVSRDHNDLGFNDLDFKFISFVGEIPELPGEYIANDEADYPAWGMSIMVINLSSQSRQAASVVEKVCQGKPWFLVQWVVDLGTMTEHVAHGHRHRDYGVDFDVRFATLGNCVYQNLAREYAEGLRNG